MTFFDAKSLDGFIDEMSKEPSPTYIGWSVQVRGSRNGTHDDARRLAQALEKLTAGENMLFRFRYQTFSEHWGLILRALAQNKRFTRWNLSDCDIHGDTAFEVARAISLAPHVNKISLGNNNMSSGAVMRVAKAALELKSLSELEIVRDRALELEADAIQALVDLRLKFSTVRYGSGAAVRALEGIICMKCIVNPVSRVAVQEGQEVLLNKFRAGEAAAAASALEDLKRKTADPEQKRLFQLMRQLMDKYGYSGGLHFCCTIPASFDKNEPQPVMSEALIDTSKNKKEIQVRELLGTAAYKQPKLVQICNMVEGHINELARSTTTEYLVPVVVNAFFEKHGLEDVSGDCPAFKATVDKKEGRFEQVGYHAGMPAFTMSGCKSLYFHHDGVQGWSISDSVGEQAFWYQRYPKSGVRALFTPKEGDVWSSPCSFGAPAGVSMALDRSKLLLKDGVAEFLAKRLNDDDTLQWLTLGLDLAKVKYGPPKSLSRALDKASAKNSDPGWLLDLNRATFVVDAPVIMVLLFHLFEAEVKKAGGAITRLSNYHFIADKDKKEDFYNTGGMLQQDMKVPPCLHMNARVDGWTYEVMIMLADFATLKEELHHYYDIVRATTPEEVLMPVFPPKVAAQSAIHSKLQAIGEKHQKQLRGSTLTVGGGSQSVPKKKWPFAR